MLPDASFCEVPKNAAPPPFLTKVLLTSTARARLADHDGFKKTSRNHISLQPHIRLAGNRDAMIVIMDEIPDEDGLRIRQTEPRSSHSPR